MVSQTRSTMELSLHRFTVTFGSLTLILFSFLSGFCNGSSFSMETRNSLSSQGRNNGDKLLSATSRRLLQDESLVQPERNWGRGEKCVKGDVVIRQDGPTPSLLTGGIPAYSVEITNSCYTRCNMSRILLNCGGFSAAHRINSKYFKRISGDDCLINDGKPLLYGGTVAFVYATTFKYPFSVKSVSC